MEIVESSGMMKAGFRQSGSSVQRMGIPFGSLPVGMSVSIPMDKVDEKMLRVVVSQMSKALNKKFRCIKHKSLGLFEVGRIADVVEEPQNEMQMWNSSPQMSGG